MKLLLNVIWVVFGGFLLWLGYLLAGVIACLTIVGIPIGLAAFRIGWFALWPFGRTVVDHPAAGAPSAIGNVLWVIFFGWWLAPGPHRHRRRPGGHHRRHPAGPGQPQAGTGVALPPRQTDRSGRGRLLLVRA